VIHRPALGPDPERNRHDLQKLLDATSGGTIELPAGDHLLADGLRVPAGWTLHGPALTHGPAPTHGPASAAARPVSGLPAGPAAWLTSTGASGQPVLHVLGSDVAIADLGLRPPPCDPGLHSGDRGTAITVGEYLYPAAPAWIGHVDIRRVHVDRGGNRAANSIALMGAVHDVTVQDIAIHGGHTGVAVHWGAVGADVGSIVGPTYHPHRLVIDGLRVRDAVEGFYLSSVHDVRVSGACLRDVEMGFRLLPGDNTDRFHRAPGANVPAARIGDRIDISDVCVQWTGDRYGARVAGWGRSEVDGVISTLDYTDTVISDCALRRVPTATAPPHTPADMPQTELALTELAQTELATGKPTLSGLGVVPPAPIRQVGRSWSPVLLEHADGVVLRNLLVESGPVADCCPLAAI
jgi:hypothetical protein